jgi:hypothetical protein
LAIVASGQTTKKTLVTSIVACLSVAIATVVNTCHIAYSMHVTIFRYLNDKNSNLSRRVSQQPHWYNHRHSSVGPLDTFNLMFKCLLCDIFYVQIQKLSRRMAIVAQ